MVIEIILVLEDEAIRQIASGHGDTGIATLLPALSQAGLVLQRLHPGVADASLARYHRLQVGDEAAATFWLARLRSTAGVVGAYVKPQDRPAGRGGPPGP